MRKIEDSAELMEFYNENKKALKAVCSGVLENERSNASARNAAYHIINDFTFDNDCLLTSCQTYRLADLILFTEDDGDEEDN